MFTGEIPQGTNYKTITAVAPEYAYLDEIVASMIQQSPASRPASIDTIKQQLIARQNEFVIRQRLSQLRQTVIPQGEINDPLILDPIRLVGMDYDKNTLIVRLQRPVTPQWVNAFRHIGNYTAIVGKGPESFAFDRDTARIPASEHQIQQLIDHFKDWLPKAHRKYQEIVTTEKRQEEERRRQQLQAEIAETERRQRILQNVRI